MTPASHDRIVDRQDSPPWHWTNMPPTNDESLNSVQLAEIRRLLSVPEDSYIDSHSLHNLATVAEDNAQNDSIEDSEATVSRNKRAFDPRHAYRSRHVRAAPLTFTKSSPILRHGMLDGAADLGKRMAHSFGSVDGDGDTQPLETQVYRQYTSSAIGMSSAVRPAAESQERQVQRDLADHWKGEEEQDDASSVGDGNISDLSPEVHYNAVDGAGGAFAVPKTPALAGRKRNSRGEILESTSKTTELKTSSTKTPGTGLSAAMFGMRHAGNLISMTQAFNQTQAPSSPLPNGPRSDPVFERPSPNLQHPRPTSPLPRTSSPFQEGQSEVSRAATEPPMLEPYRTMKESQEERMRRQQEVMEKHRAQRFDPLDDDDALFNTPTTVEKRAMRLREQGKSSSSPLSRTGNNNGGRMRQAPSRSKGNDANRGSTSAAITGSQEIQIPMTSSKPDLHAKGAVVVLSSPEQRANMATQEVPATNSQREKRAATVSKATQATAIEDSQRSRNGSQKENDDPDLDEDYSQQALSSSQRIQDSVSHISSLTGQSRKVLQSKSNDAVDTPSGSVRGPTGSRRGVVPDEQTKDMPSSPPMMTSDTHDEDGDVEESEQRDIAAAENTGDLSMKVLNDDTEQVVLQVQGVEAGVGGFFEDPESGRSHSNINLRASRSRAAGTNTTSNTNATSTAYQTAESHHTPSPIDETVEQQGTANNNTSRSIRTRKLTDIDADPTPHPSHEQADLEDINLMNDDDHDFAKLMSGSSPVRPTRKTRIVYSAKKQRRLAEALTPITPPSAKKRKTGEGIADHLPADQTRSPVLRPKLRQEQQEAAPSTDIRKAGIATQSNETNGSGTQLKRARTSDPNTRKRTDPRESLIVNPRDVAQGTKGLSGSSLNLESDGNSKDGGAEHGVTESTENPTSSGGRLHNRVVALCRDAVRNYWPATCIGQETDGRLKVVFDDGTPDSLETQHVRRLDFRAGDVVKVDLPAMKKRDYIIQDVHGTNISVSAKPSGRGAMAGKITPSTPITIPLSQIYLTGMLWPQLNGREYSHAVPTSTSRLSSTPVPMQAPSTVQTPGSRTRRAKAGLTKQEGQREASTSSFRQESTLFANTAFAASFKDDATNDRKSTLRLLSENGAQLLDQGFEDLFTVPDVSAEPSRASNRKDALRLTKEAQGLGFVALITDVHSRRPKFLQALALGLPCIHHRWVRDCIIAKRMLPWEAYLLPAGESAWLGGAIRSRILPSSDPANIKLSETISSRKRIIESDGSRGVLLVDAAVQVSKSSKSSSHARKAPVPRTNDERRKRFEFMTYGVGAQLVRRVEDINEAKAILSADESGEWAWVYIDGDVPTAKTLLFGSTTEQQGESISRKRRRKGEQVLYLDGDLTVKVVNDEAVIQSLILGTFAD